MMDVRPRRLRYNSHVREMARETRLSSGALIYPLFIKEGKGVKSPITSMEGQYHYSPDTACQAVEEALETGIGKFMLFGLPEVKDETGSQAYAGNGVVQQAIRALKARYNTDIYITTDVCMCEYTSHGHCGIIHGDHVHNDETLEYLGRIAVSHAGAGADMVVPSDMMDGRVSAIRRALDANGFEQVSIMVHSAKYASSFYGPFREAVESAPSFGDRKTYQMDFHNSREALKETLLDLAEGADMVMVKPALAYLDVIRQVASQIQAPVAAYSVSGEYAMVKAAAKAGLVDEYGVMCESAVAVFRAGAGILVTYFAKELAQAIAKGDIG